MAEFAWQKFLDNVGFSLLQEYFQKKSLEFPFKKEEEFDAEKLLTHIQNLSEKEHRKIEGDFQSINTIVNTKTQGDIVLEAENVGISVPSDVAEDHNEEMCVFWFFLNHPTIFEAIRVWDRIENFTAWEEEDLGEIKNPNEAKGKGKEIQERLKDNYLKWEKRKVKCDVEEFCHADRICYVAYPEGNPRSISKYKEGEERISHVVERPIEEVFFVVHLSEGRASVKHTRRISIERMNEIKRTFIVDVLQKKFNEELAGKQFAMEKFLDEEFGTNLKEKAGAQSDDVEFIKVRKIAWKQRSASGQKGDLSADENNELDEMYKLLRQHNVSSAYVLVRSVEIQVKFPGKGKIGSHRFDIRFPNGLRLGKDKRSLKCRKYLEKWDILKKQEQQKDDKKP